MKHIIVHIRAVLQILSTRPTVSGSISYPHHLQLQILKPLQNLEDLEETAIAVAAAEKDWVPASGILGPKDYTDYMHTIGAKTHFSRSIVLRFCTEWQKPDDGHTVCIEANKHRIEERPLLEQSQQLLNHTSWRLAPIFHIAEKSLTKRSKTLAMEFKYLSIQFTALTMKFGKSRSGLEKSYNEIGKSHNQIQISCNGFWNPL